ncbi:MAG: site-specific integrase [Clostridia bacterium]|nr:site-specific integrase [Clostridia bacterium]
MAAQRRDNRNRVLKEGESQLKNGTYRYRYTDANGVRHDIYSNRLLPTDRTPVGKREDICLREKAERIRTDLRDGIRTAAAEKETLNCMFDKYIAGKRKLKESTRVNYLYMYNTYVRETIGKRKIADIKYSDIKAFYNSLILDKHFKPHSMEVIHTVLHPTFNLAVRDEYIRTNPTTDAMREIKREHNWKTSKRHALTIDEQKAFIDFLASSEKYTPWRLLFTVFLGTGGRVSEVLGLRWSDCDFEKNVIHINHNLTYRPSIDGKAAFRITTPKTEAGIRMIPMLKAVKEALLQVREMQAIFGGSKLAVNGSDDFVFVNRLGNPYSLKTVNAAIKRILRAYNEEEAKRVAAGDTPCPIRPFTSHNLRHTFCTRLCENETNLKVIQSIMGHADIQTTMDIYAEVTEAKKSEAIANLEEKIYIA